MERGFALLFAFLLIAGCALIEPGDPNRSVWFTIPVDSRLQLHQELPIGPYQDRLYLQNGQSMAFSGVNEYLPYCAISLAQKRTVAFVIQPDSFLIKKVYQRALFDLALRQQYIAAFDRGGGMTYETIGTFMDLHSEKQPDIEALICARWGLPQNISHLTLDDIYQSLGNLFTLELLGD